jgi:hypothetical protein
MNYKIQFNKVLNELISNNLPSRLAYLVIRARIIIIPKIKLL